MGARGPQPKYSDQDYLDAIVRVQKRQGYPPTYREIAHEVGVTPGGGVNKRIKRLFDLGVVTHTPGRMRSIVIVQEKV